MIFSVSLSLFLGIVMSFTAHAQVNVALTATAAHSGGGATSYAATNYNDGNIVSSSSCSDGALPWGWLTTNGWITFTWSSAVTFNKVVLYKSNRPMNSCAVEYWNGSAYVNILNYASSACPADSFTFAPVTTTILRFNNCAGSSNPNHREIQVWLTQPAPPTVTGATTYCAGDDITLSASSPAPSPVFTWTGPAGYTGTGATITVPSITAANAGTYNCVVSTGGAPSNPTATLISVNPKPAAIGGASSICTGASTTLTDATSGGTWFSGSMGVATIVSGSGLLSALSAGTTLITYKLTSTGCQNTKIFTVNQLPSAITGTLGFCLGANTVLSNPDGGGTWTSATPGVATIDPMSGFVNSASVGLSTISYTNSSGCSNTANVSVNPLPDVTVTPPGPTTICLGETTSFTASSPNPLFALLSQDFESGLGGWIVTGSALPANKWQIVTPASSADFTPGDGSNMMQAAAQGALTTTVLTSSSFSTLGFGSATLTFNQYLLSTGDNSILIQYSTNGGSSWTTLTDQTNFILGSPSWSAALPNYTLVLPAGAIGQSDVKLRWTYDANAYYWFIDNILVQAALPASTYNWTGALGLSCAACTNPDITPTSTGANAYSVTVTSSAGCTTTNGVIVNVNPLPGPITGNLNICVGTTFTLGNGSTGGTWSASNGNVSIVSGTGVMAGIAVGSSTITYTLPTGCMTTAVATVSPTPTSITGPTSVCVGLTTALSHPVSGGTWASANTGVATINSFGVVTGGMPGTTTITYTLPSGCVVWRDQTVNPSPAPITGTATVCVNSNTTLACATGGGFWSSGATAVAMVDASGVVTGMSDGYAVITYSLLTGCQSIKIVTVNALPAPITGTLQVCQGGNTTLMDATPGGTWSSNFTLVAGINSSGLVTGNSAGNAVISYTLSSTGCGVAAIYTVNPLPNDNGGIMEVCVGDMTSLTNTTFGGTWSSSNTSVLVIDPLSGIATGMLQGNATVTYALSTGCRKTSLVTVNALPGPISGTPRVCVGQTTTLFNFTPGGGWTTGNSSIADISSTGVLTGVNPGQAQISYVLGTGCQINVIATVDAMPPLSTGIFQVCSGSSTLLSNADIGGTWSSSNSSVASVNSAGLVTGGIAGNATITYTNTLGCYQPQGVVVNPLPGLNSGPASVCEGQTITWTNSAPGGIWISENPSIASVNALGVITGVAAGVTNITYTLPTGCERIRSVIVNQTPGAILGDQVCLGLNTTLTSTPAGGVWTTGSSVIAPVGNTTGVATGATAGNTIMTYTLPAGCRSTAPFVVHPSPAPITGNTNVCQGLTTTLSDASAGGTWSISPAVSASIDMNTGVVTGITGSTTATVVYTLPTTCIRSTTVVVNPLPAPIFGVLNVCIGSATALTNTTPGGTWSSSNTAVASISSTGNVIGLSNGVTNIIYTMPTSCMSTASVVVNPLPANITGGTTMCVGQSTTLSNTTPGGNWTSNNPVIASVNGAGVVTGNSDGNTLIVYTLLTGCQKSINVVVNPLPATISGSTTVCQGNSTILSDATPGGTWSSSDPVVAPIGLTSGIATGSNVGFSIISYTLPTGCYRTASMIVNDLPDVITGTLSVCAGGTTQLENATGGGTWSNATSVAIINASGMVTGIAAGTTRITYSIGNSCRRIAVMTVNALPNLIAGVPSVCPGFTTILSNANIGGVWTSDNTVVADINAVSGVVTGYESGMANITYTLPTGCLRAKSVTVHPSVEAMTGSMTICKGETTMLSDGTPGGVWISGNTTVATIGASTGEVTGVAAGAAMVTYAMPTGCMVMGNVVVNALPANITGAGSVCEGSVTTLGSTSGGGSWSSSDDAIAMVDGVGGVSGVMPGSATIMYTLPTGCMTSREMVVNVMPAMNTVTGGGSYCHGGAGVSIGLDGSENGTMYTLKLGSSNLMTLTGTGSTLDFGMKTLGGIYTVRAVNSLGCTLDMTDNASITINPLITPSVSVSSDNGDTVCGGTLVTFTATGVDGGTAPEYIWSVGGVPVTTGTTYAVAPDNGDVISVMFTSSEVCASPANVFAGLRMTVIPNLMPSVNISVAPDDTVCQGSTAAFYAAGSNGGTAPVYTWIVGGVPVPGVNGPAYAYIPTNGQAVICKLTSNYRCPVSNNVSSNMINMHVDAKYIPEVEIIAQPGTIIHSGETVTFTTHVTGGGPIPRYQWLIRGLPVTGATQPTFTSKDFDDGDSVTCIVYGTGICGMATINSVVMKVTPSTGVSQATLNGIDIRLVPNPNNGAFSLTGTLGATIDELVSLEIANMLGQVVYSGKLTVLGGAINERIQLSNTLANGMYVLNINTGSDRKVFHFVVKN